MNKQIRYGSLIAYFNIILNLIINFALTPFMLHSLGSSEYGVYKIVQSFTGQLAIMSFGLSTVAARYVVLYNTQEKSKEKQNFLAIMYCLGTLLTVGVLALGGVLYLSMDAIYGKSLTIHELAIAKELCIILVLNVAFSILCDAFIGIIRAYEHFVISNFISTFRLIFRLLSIVILLSIGVKSLGIVITDLAITLLILFFSILYVKYVLKEKAHFYSFDKQLIKEIATFSLAVFLQAIVNQVNQNMDNTILGIMTSTSVVTVYSIALTLYTCFISLVTALSSMFGPSATKLVAKGASGEELTDFVVEPGRIQTMIALLGILGFAVVGKDFIQMWMGEGFDDVYVITLILIVPALIPLVESVTNTILDAMMKRMARSVALLAMCAINVISSIIFIRSFGYIGAAFGTALSVIMGHGIIINLYLQKRIGLNIFRMFKEIFCGILPAFLFSMIVGYFISLIPGSGFLVFGTKVVLLIIEYFIFMYWLGMNRNEKSSIKQIIERKQIR